MTPETTSVSVTYGDKLPTLFPPDVTINGKDYDGDLTFTAQGLVYPYEIDETGSVFDASDGSMSPAVGTYTFTYVVTDDNGLKGTSAPVTITVKPTEDGPLVPTLPNGPCGQPFC